MPTLQDVAKLAGVSTATVSKVLSNTPYFTEDTRNRVMAAVEALGYTPNLPARALASGKSQIIAVVFPYVYEAFFTDPVVLRILEGVESECTQRGYNMLLSSPHLSQDGPDAHYVQMLQSGYLQGVLAIDNVPIASVMEPVRQRKIPGVTIGYHPNSYYVCSDDYGGGRQLMSEVLALGHRLIGIITVPEALHFSIGERMRGLRDVAQAQGVDFDALPSADGDFSVRSGEQSAADLLAAHPELSAIVCLNDRMAMGAVQAARTGGWQVPETLTVVGYDDIPSAATFSPPLTTIDQQARELGQTGARMLFDLLSGQQPEPLHMPTRLVIRQSSGPAKGGAGG